MAYSLTGVFAVLIVLLGVVAFRAVSRMQRLERAGRCLIESMTQADLTALQWERKPSHMNARLMMVRALSGLRDTR